ncbi:MAG: bifunctional precorrin-2 dehydrogenase/sirohydrochlorin ferrochelatase [Actinomycetota bacterium]|nr:bifunctional precorrin-2 dehydrogenase/sirohydrochlorin ferrochelatase [Actinomycetota bacterium]
MVARTGRESLTFSFPISLDVTGRRCVVIGGGPQAVERAATLRDAGADVLLVPADGYRHDLLDGALLAIVTSEDDTDPAAVFADAEARWVLVNTLDDVAHCHFAFPAVVRRGDLRVAISTAGKAPALARQLRIRLEQELPAALATLVEVLSEAREAALPRCVSFAEWTDRWRQALADLDSLLAQCEDGRGGEVRDRILQTVTREAS